MTEQFKDVTIKYIYVSKFDWLHPIEREQFLGHPLKGRVYRDIFNPQTGNHKILVPGLDGGLGFDNLKATNDLADFDLREITLDTILDFDIVEDDLDLMNQWIESGNKDIEQRYEPTIPQGLNRLREALHNQKQDEAEALARATESMMHLWVANPDKFSVMVNFINFLTDADLDSLSDPANYIRLHPTDGKGVNIAQALRAIDTYNGDNRRTNENMVDLYIAMEALTVECERRYVNDLLD